MITGLVVSSDHWSGGIEWSLVWWYRVITSGMPAQSGYKGVTSATWICSVQSADQSRSPDCAANLRIVQSSCAICRACTQVAQSGDHDLDD